MDLQLSTARLTVRDWSQDDARDAFAIYGSPEVAHWLTPAMAPVPDVAAMTPVLQRWRDAQHALVPPLGRWAVQRTEDGAVVGGLGIHRLPPYDEDFELTWQLNPQVWGRGYAVEAAAGLIDWAFTHDVDELFAVARPANARAVATARRLGMQWVGETTKYYGLTLQVYRIRPGDRPPDRRRGRG